MIHMIQENLTKGTKTISCNLPVGCQEIYIIKIANCKK